MNTTAPRTSLGQPNLTAIVFFLVFVAPHPRHHLLGGAADTHDRAVLRRRAAASAPLQNGFALAGDYMSAASFLGIAGLVATVGLRRPHLLGGLAGGLAGGDCSSSPSRCATSGKYTFADVVASRLRQTPVRIAAGDRHAHRRIVLSHRADGGRRQPDPPDVRPPYEMAVVHRRRGDDRLRALRRDDRHHLGADRQGGAAARRARRCWRCWCSRASASTRWRCSHAAADAVRRRRARARASSCPIRWTRSRWAWR